MKTKLITLILILFAALCAAQEINTQLSKPIEPLIELLNKHIQEKHIPGAMISIVNSQGVIYSDGIGFADVKKQEKVTPNHLFRLGSISKSITAMGLLKLGKEKEIPLDTPIKDIDNSIVFSNPWQSDSPVTIENLLEHTSGFDDMHLHAIYNREDKSEPATNLMVKAHEKSLTSRWKPGTFVSYSNPGYVVAGHVLETLAEIPYQEYLKNNVLEPLEMFQTGFYFTEPKQLFMTQGYQYNGVGYDTVAFTSINGGPAGGICSNARDMSLYLQFMLNHQTQDDDTLGFTTDDFNRIENAQTGLGVKSGLRSGYALGNYPVWKNGYLFHGHTGGIDGFSSSYIYSREADIGIAISINRQGNATEISDMILDYFLGKQQAPKKRVKIKIPEKLKQKYTGYYTFMNPRNSLLYFTDKMLGGVSLEFQTDTINVKNLFGKQRYVLTYAGNNQFYRDDQGITSAILLENDNNEPAFMVGGSYSEKDSRAKRLIIAIAVMISIILVLVFSVYGLIWLFIWMFTENKKPAVNHLVLWIGCLGFCLMFGSFAMAMEDLPNAGVRSFKTVMVFLSSFVMLVFSVLSIFRWFKLDTSKKFRFYYVLTSLALLIVVLFLYDADFIGLKLWSY